MSQQIPNSEYREDEIDLRKLFQAIGKGFSNVGKGIINAIIRIKRTTLRYRILLIAMLIVGVIAGALFTEVSKPYYRTSMVISSDYFNSRLVDNSLEKLNSLCKENDRSGLAQVLNINKEVAENIKEFDYEPMVSEQDVVDVEVLKQKLEELKVKDTDISKVIDQINIENKNSYIISVYVYDNRIIDNLQNALVAYFANNPYIKNRVRINKDNQLRLIDKLQADISQLDSLKHAFNLNLKANASRKGETTSNVYVGESGALNPTEVYTEGVSLYRQLLSVRKEMELGSDFELIDGFTVFSKPESPGYLKASAFSALIFLGLAYLIIIIIETNRYLNKVEKERFNS
ncbi:MAG: hypothetical protein KDC79_11010 [Cyclobacteriaceae bacterium]|nr:hypothetical protein [Cyclobacteriaceae bacterium]